jgi:REP element-mobilizing transposase RayT
MTVKIDPEKHDRQSIRLRDFDYSQPGAYFITCVTHRRQCILGEVVGGETRLSAAGEVVWDTWNSLPARYPEIELGAAVVMPNHFHGIIQIAVGAIHELPQPVGAVHEPPLQQPRRRMTLPLVMGYFKMNSAKRINELRCSTGLPVWQHNYYEHIIRNDDEHQKIHLYIDANPANWAEDEENPLARHGDKS